MITWTFDINGTAVEEPKGFSDIILNMSRDNEWHGIFFEASTSTLSFYGVGAELLRAERNSNGLAAEAKFTLTASCGEDINVISGNFDFGTYRDKCGTTCFVEIAVEKSGCIMTMRNRYDQKVDLSKPTAFDNTTLLQDYTGLNINLELTAQKLSIGNEAEMTEESVVEVITGNPNWVDSNGFNTYIGWISPSLPTITNSSLGDFNASPIVLLAGPLEGVPNRPPYPDFPTATGTATLIGDITCDLTATVASFRLKGIAAVTISGVVSGVNMQAKIFKLPAGLDGTVAANWIELYSAALFGTIVTATTAFDLSATISVTLAQGDFIYFGISTRGTRLDGINFFQLTFDKETFYKLTTSSTCESTSAGVSMVNETGARIVESITDGCLNMKSDYYGRIDSYPYQSNEDGCGSLRVLANGLSIRNATPDSHFISLQEFFTGLRGIDNIGMGVEDNTVTPGIDWLRIEPIEYFYQNIQVLTLPFIPASDSSLDSRMGYSKILIGYNMWEVQKVNGLGEFNSNKEFRTSLKTIDNTLDAKSNFVAGGIPIEITRQQSFATSGSADTKYDNETFIICVDRGGYDYIVEKGNIDNPANIFSPLTAYNWRIRPMYNLMRWAKSIFQSYVNLANTTSKLFFSSGTGNYIAEGQLPAGDPCKLESVVVAEDDDLSKYQFAGTDYVPIYKPEIVTFEYPLSIADYLVLRAKPYGYVSFQCGTGDYEKGFIKSLAYKPVEGIATFTLIKKWQ